MNAVNHFRRAGMKAIRNEKRGGQTGRSDAKTDRHLLHGAGDGTGVACLLVGDVGIDKGVHARILQRSESAINKSLERDDPDGSVETNCGEEEQEKAEDYSV